MREEGNFEERVLSLFILFELAKGSESCWFPYFNTIGDIDLLSVWSDDELSLLKD